MADNSLRNSEAIFDNNSYEALKQRVHLLKKEHQKVVQTNKSHKEVETVALVQQRQRYELLVEELEDEVSGLQAQLRQNTERSTKMRLHNEKDKKNLLGQVDRLTKALDCGDAQHAAALSNCQAEFEMLLASARNEIEDLKRGREEDRRAFERAHQNGINEVDEWCQGEVEAVRHVCGQQTEALQEKANEWQRKCEEMVKTVSVARGIAEEDTQRLRQAELHVTHLEVLLEEMQSEKMALLENMEEQKRQFSKREEQASCSYKCEVQTLKAAHREQLDLVDARLKQVVARKDSTIAALKSELVLVHEKLQKFEVLIIGSTMNCKGSKGLR
ncbi:hypothetical protein CEUSTIGMA_g5129.t1 [Chlamydomonas eustigma]|uniref:Uncharacterized protein n=1 Tax=Chlamydomonas eustigma TaxID=1157962 RepID=A0A250X3Q1_9CHLO|nr:hypothetical protein CEUSTIGMA_g5129.t1 [Chlamydomonas eustigma]|eukprot:GAX77686.1 hypothetical protein CEUSTIGMA_g5129.t1 [Chlamydomonas eustigma]